MKEIQAHKTLLNSLDVRRREQVEEQVPTFALPENKIQPAEIIFDWLQPYLSLNYVISSKLLVNMQSGVEKPLNMRKVLIVEDWA